MKNTRTPTGPRRRCLTRLALGAAICGGAVLLLIEGPPPRPAPSRNDANSPAHATVRVDQASDVELIPLPASAVAGWAAPVGRNIFEYASREQTRVATAAGIVIRSLDPPILVAGTPRSAKVVVSGEGFPEDAEIVIGGVTKQAWRVSERELSVELVPGELPPGNLTVEVRSKLRPSDHHSNALTLVIQAPPEPPRLVGIIGDLGVFELGKGSGSAEAVRLRAGAVIEAWRVDAVGEDWVDMTDLRYDTRRRLRL